MDAEISAKRAGQLDAVRAFSVAAVVFSHTIPSTYYIGNYFLGEVGAYGVYIFFVLSAYLITSQLLITRDIRAEVGDSLVKPLRLFYAKRVLRLFPAYYVAIVGAAAINIAGMRSEFPWHALQLSDILFAMYPAIENTSAAGHLWSLTVEWQFYLLWPLVVLVSPDKRLAWIAVIVLAISMYIWSPIGYIQPVIDRTNIVQSLDSLAFGALLALAQHRHMPLQWLNKAFWPAVALCMAGLSLYAVGLGHIGEWFDLPTHEAMNFIFTVIVWRAASGYDGWVGRVLNTRWLQYIGVISYGVYVYHMFILAFYQKVTGHFGLPTIPWGPLLSIALFLASVAAAAVSWRLVESPINNLRRHFSYGRSRNPTSAVEPGNMSGD